MPDSRAYLLQSAGGLGGGVGCAALALPFTLLAYLFSGGDLVPTLAGEGVCLGIGSALGAWSTSRTIGRPANFWPALGLALLPEIGSGLVIGLTHKEADLADPVVVGCFVTSIIGSPILATIGANLGRRDTAGRTSSRIQLVPELAVACRHHPGTSSEDPRVSAGLGLRFTF